MIINTNKSFPKVLVYYMVIKENFRKLLQDTEKVKASLAVAFLLSITLFFFGPSFIYYINILEIPYYYTDMVGVFIIYSIVTGLIISTILVLLKGNLHQRAVVFVFALGLLFWIQGNILVWDYGVLDGREIIWNNYFLNGIIDSAIWIAVLAIALIKAPVFYKHIALASVILLVIQGGGLATEILQAPDEPDWKNYYIGYDDDSMFEFSEEQNVIVLVLDMFQSDIFQEIITEDPEYAEIFDGFTYYRNTVGGFPTTHPSVTFILTGQYYDNSIPIQDFIKNSFLNNSVPLILKEEGYQVDLYPMGIKTIYSSNETASNVGTENQGKVDKEIDELKAADEMLQLTIFRYVPHYLKSQFYFVPFVELGDDDNVHQDVAFHNSLVSNTIVTNDNEIFKFYHIIGAHAPYTLNSELQNEELPQNRSGCIEQSKAALKVAGEMIEQLKENDIYDNSMIFVIGDHGNPWASADLNAEVLYTNNESNEYYYVNKNVVSSAIPLMLVKPFNSSGDLKISDAPVSNGDIPKTIESELNLSNEFPGESIFTINESDERERKFYYYIWDGSQELEYLPQFEQYSINGHSWLTSSWAKTGLTYKPGEGSKNSRIYECSNLISFGTNGTAQQYQTAGWSIAENKFTWTDGQRTILSVQPDITDSDLLLTINATPFLVKGVVPQQRVNISVNNHHIGEWTFNQSGIQEKTIIIPQNVLNKGVQNITFEFPDAISPKEAGVSEGERLLALAVRSFKIEKL